MNLKLNCCVNDEIKVAITKSELAACCKDDSLISYYKAQAMVKIHMPGGGCTM